MSPNLQDGMPNELLDRIFSYCTRLSIIMLCRCSKKINRITTPLLYSRVDLLLVYTQPFINPWLLPFAHLIFTSQLHASYVKSFSINLDSRVFEEEEQEHLYPEVKRPWPEQNPDKLEKTLKKACQIYTETEDDAAQLYDTIKTGNEEGAIVALLIAHLKNLQKLDFCIESGLNFNVLRAFEFIKYRDHSSTPLDVIFTGKQQEMFVNEALHLAALFNIPYVTSLYAWKAGDNEIFGAPQFSTLKPQSSFVELIELRSSKLRHQNLKCLMNATIPGKLKTFIYEVGLPRSPFSISVAKAIKCLEPHYDTLESLAFSHDAFFPRLADKEGKTLSFRMFKALKRLKVAPVCIWGFDAIAEEPEEADEEESYDPSSRYQLRDALPQQLEVLWIVRADPANIELPFIPRTLIPGLHALLEHHQQSSKLAHINIGFHAEGWDPKWFEGLRSFGLLAEERGIRSFMLLDDVPLLDHHHAAERGWGWCESVQWRQCYGNYRSIIPPMSLVEEGNLVAKAEQYGVQVGSVGMRVLF